VYAGSLALAEAEVPAGADVLVLAALLEPAELPELHPASSSAADASAATAIPGHRVIRFTSVTLGAG
jgi:hypothetical protein